MCDKCDGVITRVTSLSGIFLTLMFLGMRSLMEGFFKQNLCHGCHTRFAVVSPLSSCCISSLILPITLPHALLNLTLTKKLLEKQQNHGFLSKKYTSQALYQTLHTTKMNFEKLSGAKKFSEKTTISIHFNLLQVCPSWPIFVFAGLFNSSISFLMFVENIFLFQSIGGSSNC